MNLLRSLQRARIACATAWIQASLPSRSHGNKSLKWTRASDVIRTSDAALEADFSWALSEAPLSEPTSLGGDEGLQRTQSAGYSCGRTYDGCSRRTCGSRHWPRAAD